MVLKERKIKMKIYKDIDTGFTAEVTDDSLIIKMPIENLINGFDLDPTNFWEDKSIAIVDKEKSQEFAEYLAEKLFDEADTETGESYMTEMLSRVFNEAIEGAEDFLTYTDEESDEE
jgi:hypothetical protein